MNIQPEIGGLSLLMAKWTDEELQAFFYCVRTDDSFLPPADRDKLISGCYEELFWAYNSRAKARATYAAEIATRLAYEAMPGALKRRLPVPSSAKFLHEYGSALSYEMLLRECCAKLKIGKSAAEDSRLLEIYLCEKLMILAVAAMTAEERHLFFTREVQVNDLSAGFPQTGLEGPATTFAALGAAQASGFGIYLGASTALGFLSHGVGITLPFALYTGMSSTIAFLIGPAGFLAAGAWLGASLTSPEWIRIARGLVYIIMMRAKYEYDLRAPRLSCAIGN